MGHRNSAVRTTYRICYKCIKGFQAEYEYTDGDDPGMMFIETRCKECQEEPQMQPTGHETEFNLGDGNEILISSQMGDELWRFIPDDLDTLLVELELLLIAMRDGIPVSRVAIEAAFDHIKRMRTARISAA
jgi:hypothetical protein